MESHCPRHSTEVDWVLAQKSLQSKGQIVAWLDVAIRRIRESLPSLIFTADMKKRAGAVCWYSLPHVQVGEVERGRGWAKPWLPLPLHWPAQCSQQEMEVEICPGHKGKEGQFLSLRYNSFPGLLLALGLPIDSYARLGGKGTIYL